jgi:hypothetical protein
MTINWDLASVALAGIACVALAGGIYSLIHYLRRSGGKRRSTQGAEAAASQPATAVDAVSVPTSFRPEWSAPVKRPAPMAVAPLATPPVQRPAPAAVAPSATPPAMGTDPGLADTVRIHRVRWSDLLGDDDPSSLEVREERQETTRRMASGSHPALPGLPPSVQKRPSCGHSAVYSIEHATTRPMALAQPPGEGAE